MRRNNWVYLIILVILTGILWIVRNKPEWLPAKEEPTPTAQVQEYVFNGNSSDVMEIAVSSNDGRETLIKRGSENFWVVVKPGVGTADPSLAEAAASQVTAILILNKFEDTPEDSAVGLDMPQFTISVKLKDQEEQILQVGALTPTQAGYYVRAGGKVMIASTSGIDALTNLLDNPPFPAATSTPAP